MIASQKFQKALLLLDRGALERGEALLREVIIEAQDDLVTLIQSLVCLGDFLGEAGVLRRLVSFWSERFRKGEMRMSWPMRLRGPKSFLVVFGRLRWKHHDRPGHRVRHS